MGSSIGDAYRCRDLAAVRHREVEPFCPDLGRPLLHAARQPYGRLRAPGDLDIAPGERARDPEADRLADRLLAGEAGGVVLRGVRPGVAVSALRLGEAALPERRVPLERAADPLDLDQVDPHGAHPAV